MTDREMFTQALHAMAAIIDAFNKHGVAYGGGAQCAMIALVKMMADSGADRAQMERVAERMAVDFNAFGRTGHINPNLYSEEKAS